MGKSSKPCVINDLEGTEPTAEQANRIAEHLRDGHALLGGSPLLSAEQAAAYLSVPISFIRRETLAGRLKSVTLGARYRRYAIRDLDSFANAGRAR
jgi:hypothetical protein